MFHSSPKPCRPASSRPGRRESFAAPLVALVALLVAPLAIPVLASTPATDTTAADAQQDARQAAEAGRAAADQESEAEAEEDVVWYQEADGRRYRVVEMPKVEGEYRWIDDETIRGLYGQRFKVVREDEDTFYIKRYDTTGQTVQLDVEKNRPTQTEVEATYAVDVATTDRLVLEPFDTGLPNEGQWRNGFVLVDLDGDGHLDIVHSPARKDITVPIVFHGDGEGAWTRWTPPPFAPAPYDYGDVAVGDLDGDGRLDLALGIHLTGLLALRQNDEGGFDLWSEGLELVDSPGEAAGQTFSSRAIALADWNGDGRLDLVALGEGPRLDLVRAGPGPANTDASIEVGPRGFVVHLNQGDGTWVRKGDPAGAARRPVFGDSLTVADIDGDGDTDAVLGVNVMGRRDVLRLGDGEGGWEIAELAELRPRAYYRAFTAADLDGDGRLDLAGAYMAHEGGTWRTGIDAFLRRGDGWERRALVVEEHRRGLFALAHGDLDGDGVVDLVGGSGDGELWVLLGEGDGTFARLDTDAGGPPGGCRSYDLGLADLDGDGRDEIVASYAGESSAMFAPDRCPSQGALQAWDPKPARAETGSDQPAE